MESLVNQVFGKLRVVRPHKGMYLCYCSCGRMSCPLHVMVFPSRLLNGSVTSCLSIEKLKTYKKLEMKRKEKERNKELARGGHIKRFEDFQSVFTKMNATINLDVDKYRKLSLKKCSECGAEPTVHPKYKVKCNFVRVVDTSLPIDENNVKILCPSCRSSARDS